MGLGRRDFEKLGMGTGSEILEDWKGERGFQFRACYFAGGVRVILHLFNFVRTFRPTNIQNVISTPQPQQTHTHTLTHTHTHTHTHAHIHTHYHLHHHLSQKQQILRFYSFMACWMVDKSMDWFLYDRDLRYGRVKRID